MNTARGALRKAIEAYTAEGPDDGPNDGPEEKALVELLDAIQAFDESPRAVGEKWRRIMAAVPVFLSASADQVRDLRVAWEAFEAAGYTESGGGPGLFDGNEPAERKPRRAHAPSPTTSKPRSPSARPAGKAPPTSFAPA